MKTFALWLLVIFTGVIATFTVLSYFKVDTTSNSTDCSKEIKEINKTVSSMKSLLNSINDEVRLHIADDVYNILNTTERFERRYTDWGAMYMNANYDKLKNYINTISR